jgi:DNA-binding phage protein
MRISPPKTSRLLSVLRAAALQQGLNPYRIAKSSGLPLTTVQRLLTIKLNVPLRNVEMLMEALGLNLQVVSAKGARTAAPARAPKATKMAKAKGRGRPKSRR